MSIRILLADDHEIFRDGLRTLLLQQKGMDVVAEAADGHETVSMVQRHAPDVVIMDIGMPELNGFEATRQILHSHPDVKIIILSMHTDSVFVVNALDAGAMGYVEKNCAFGELVKAISAAMDNHLYLSSGIAGSQHTEGLALSLSIRELRSSLLTAREREVLQWQAKGQSTREIAELLHVSVKTIETHRQNIMKKLDLHSIAELTKYAIRTGLTTLED